MARTAIGKVVVLGLLAGSVALACDDGSGSGSASDASPSPNATATDEAPEPTSTITRHDGASSSGGRLAAFLFDSTDGDFGAQDLGPGDKSLLELLPRPDELPLEFRGDFNSDVRRMSGGDDLPPGELDLAYALVIRDGEPEGVDTYSFIVHLAVGRLDGAVELQDWLEEEIERLDVAMIRSSIEADIEEGEALRSIDELVADDLGPASFAAAFTIDNLEFDYDRGEYLMDGPVLVSMTWDVYLFAVGEYFGLAMRNSFGAQSSGDLDLAGLARRMYERVSGEARR
jgi:hypothetical protein